MTIFLTGYTGSNRVMKMGAIKAISNIDEVIELYKGTFEPINWPFGKLYILDLDSDKEAININAKTWWRVLEEYGTRKPEMLASFNLEEK